tara:strand:- start:1269 stop:1862 length:594 start_codon:yes stop_codon:yes gene_type:complete
MSKELAEKVNRIRNTYHYQIDSGDGLNGRAEIGNFDFIIPPFPFPEHNNSQLAIFTFHSFYVCEQSNTQRVDGQNPNQDVSGFYVMLSGLAVRNRFVSTDNDVPAQAGNGMINQNEFLVLNKYGDGATTTSNIYNVLSGGELTQGNESLIGNPAGTSVNCSVQTINGGNDLGDNAFLSSTLQFSIELIPADISSGNI